MKRIITAMLTLAISLSCSQNLLSDLNSRITLDPSNTYKVGEPVTFNIDGVPDGLVFYSGENGHQFKYRNRAVVPFEDITGIILDGRIQPRFGVAGGLDIYVSKDWNWTLSGQDELSDRATVQRMFDNGMPGWDKIEWTEAASKEWGAYGIDLAPYAENFAIAFHWHPTSNEKTVSQRTYWVDGSISVKMNGVDPSSMNLRDLEVLSVNLSGKPEEAYKYNKGNGSVIYNNNAAQLVFQGVAATDLDYDIDAWVFSRPMSLNSVQPDRCEVLKSFTSTVTSYSYTYDKPGSYEATFVSYNETIQGRNEQVKKIRVTVTY